MNYLPIFECHKSIELGRMNSEMVDVLYLEIGIQADDAGGSEGQWEAKTGREPVPVLGEDHQSHHGVHVGVTRPRLQRDGHVASAGIDDTCRRQSISNADERNLILEKLILNPLDEILTGKTAKLTDFDVKNGTFHTFWPWKTAKSTDFDLVKPKFWQIEWNCDRKNCKIDQFWRNNQTFHTFRP